jgi:hypothetical protein
MTFFCRVVQINFLSRKIFFKFKFYFKYSIMPRPRRSRRSRHSHHTSSVEWHDNYTDFLVEERRRRNAEYYATYGRSRVEFWNSIARRFVT